ncbi:MAG: hypothetical protein ABH851_06980 [Methanobacteriota archaeon]
MKNNRGKTGGIDSGLFKKLITVLVLIVVLFSLYLLLKGPTESPSTPENTSAGELETQKPEISEAGRTTDLKGHALAHPRYEQAKQECLALKDAQERGKCLNMVDIVDAAISLDVGKCDRIQDPYYLKRCVTEVAFRTDIQACERLEDLEGREYCYARVADDSGDPVICDRIQDSCEREECISVTKAHIIIDRGGEQECLNLSVPEYHNLCFEVIVIRNGIDYCETLESDLRDKCVSVIHLNNFIHNKDPNACEKIPLTQYKLVCRNVMVKGKVVDSDGDGMDDINELMMARDPSTPDEDTWCTNQAS